MKTCLVIMDPIYGMVDSDLNLVEKDNYLLFNNILTELITEKSFDHIVGSRLINSEGSSFEKLLGFTDLQKESEIRVLEGVEKVIEKCFDREQYSCFTLDFIDFIKSNEIEKICFVGMDANNSILASAFDSFRIGLPFTVYSRYCESVRGNESFQATINIISDAFDPDWIDYWVPGC